MASIGMLARAAATASLCRQPQRRQSRQVGLALEPALDVVRAFAVADAVKEHERRNQKSPRDAARGLYVIYLPSTVYRLLPAAFYPSTSHLIGIFRRA